MKFNISCTLLVFLTFLGMASAQKMKKIEVCEGPYNLYFISAHITFNEDNSPRDTTYLVLAKNNKYSHITDLITIKAGTFNEVWNFFTHCLEFLQKEDVGMSETHQGNLISVSKLSGFKIISVYGEGKDSSGYANYNAKYLDKLLGCLEDWEEKNIKPK